MSDPDFDLIQRLRTEMYRAGMNARELAEKADVGRSFVYDVLSGKNTNPTTKKLSSIAQVLGTNLEFLLSGQHPAARSGFAESGNADILEDLVAIPSLTLQASAGGGTIVSSEEAGKYYYFHKSWIRDTLHTRKADLRILFVRGDSMTPTLNEGDMVLVDLARNLPSPAGIFVLYDGIGLVVKRLESTLDATGRRAVRIASDNPHYPPYNRAPEEINVIGRVVWFARELL